MADSNISTNLCHLVRRCKGEKLLGANYIEVPLFVLLLCSFPHGNCTFFMEPLIFVCGSICSILEMESHNLVISATFWNQDFAFA